MPTEADAYDDGDVCIPLTVDAAMNSPEHGFGWAWAHHGLIVPGQPWWSGKAAVRRSESEPPIQEAAAAQPESDWLAHLDWLEQEFAAPATHAPPAAQNDLVNQPPHYTAGKIEVIEILEQTAAGAPDPVLAGLQWQTLKYLLRMWLKGNPAQDAQKARWYLDRLITRLTTTT